MFYANRTRSLSIICIEALVLVLIFMYRNSTFSIEVVVLVFLKS